MPAPYSLDVCSELHEHSGLTLPPFAVIIKPDFLESSDRGTEEPDSFLSIPRLYLYGRLMFILAIMDVKGKSVATPSYAWTVLSDFHGWVLKT